MSSNVCSCTTVSTTVGGTLTGGIQDIAALLPLLGTEQCEDHVSSALTKGFLYAAASPMSLFGSLGLARAGLKTFVASFAVPTWNIVGARTLSNMGFRPQGMNLSLIMIDPNDKDGRYLVDSRLEKLVEELHIDRTKIQDVQHRSFRWNLAMIFLSAVLSSFGIFPYIFLTVKIGTTLPHHTRWTFPALRVVGGFLTTITMQFVIQRRITTLAQRWISEHCSNETSAGKGRKPTNDSTSDVEKRPGIIVTDNNSSLTWFLLVLLLLGVLASIVGYVGCFSVVQSANRSTGPLSWLCLEAGLSLLRMFLWGYNPAFDDAPPLELILARDPDPPLPTCKLYDHDITTAKILPLTRANHFLNLITSFTGVVERFDHPDVTLYYTLTWNAFHHADSHRTALHEPGEHILYITIFDHKERANTRVYVQRGGADCFYATESSLPVIDPKQGLLEITLGDKVDNEDDPITSDLGLRSKLDSHYRSIMGQMRFAMRQPQRNATYTIENRWTMAMVHTTSTRQSEVGETMDRIDNIQSLSIRDFRYLQHGRLEKICQSLCSVRGEWIATYTNWGIRGIREKYIPQASTGIANDVGEVPTGRTISKGKIRMPADEKDTWESPRPDQEDVESHVVDHIHRMELLLLQEMEIWEEHLWDQANKFIGRKDVRLDKARLMKEWKRSFRTRLDIDIRAMEARLDAAEPEVNASHCGELTKKWQSTCDDIRKAWQALAEKPTLSLPPTDLSHLERLQDEYQKSARDIEAIIGWSQLTAAQREQLWQQSEVVSRSTIELNESVFWMDDTTPLITYKLSRSQWMNLNVERLLTHPPEFYTRALVMTEVIFIFLFGGELDGDFTQVAELIRNLPSSVTSILVPAAYRLSAVQRDPPLFINDGEATNKIETFLHDNQSQLARTRRTCVFIDIGPYFKFPRIFPTMLHLWPRSKIAVSFFGPPSGSLVLRLTHLPRNAGATLTLTEFHTLRTFEYSITSSFTTTNIIFFPSPSSYPSFVPNTRNSVIIEVTKSFYMVHNIRLLDEAGNDYNIGEHWMQRRQKWQSQSALMGRSGYVSHTVHDISDSSSPSQQWSET